MKQLIVGILAHVDAGKTTLSEGLLYTAGNIRKAGRVDNGDAFLDHFSLERSRGITIFSKQAELTYGDSRFTLLDTPGHVDFSAEMERTLQVLDYAILVISASDGVQGHTRTVWQLLARYHVPVLLFVNKMDQPDTDARLILAHLKEKLDDSIVDFTDPEAEDTLETAALCEESLMEKYLEEGTLSREELCRLIRERKLYPCWFGSALKMQGVQEFLQGLDTYTLPGNYPAEFGARVYKITRDENGNRLTHLKVTGGVLKPKQILSYRVGEEERQEKVNQLRLYSGVRFQALEEAMAGMVCAVSGLTDTRPGQGLGFETESAEPLLEPVLNYQILLPPGLDPAQMLPKLKMLEEEAPELSIVWEETLREIHTRIMGEVQLEVLQSLIRERFGIEVSFGDGKIIYRETIANRVEGVGHFEPLRHYAEVHLLMEPGEPGSGLVFDSVCSEDVLSRNWQRLILTHLAERVHKGVLTRSAITDMKITLVNGRAHIKHTEGGDFRQATYRAVRQGLMQAQSVLLEPWYSFRLAVPQTMVGRAMTDIENRCGIPEPPVTEGEMAVLTGIAPVVCMRNYQKDVIAYTRGMGQLSLAFYGYRPCHNTEEVVEEIGYDPDSDLANPSSSVFCTHGSGFAVPWYEVPKYMHLEAWEPEKGADGLPEEEYWENPREEERWIGTDEIDDIIARTFYANGRDRSLERKGIGRRDYGATRTTTESRTRVYSPRKRLPEYLLVDGYNIIFAWKELSALAETNIDAARERLMDILCDYQGARGMEVIVVFDAYRVQGHQTEVSDYLNIHVVFTKEAETADQYIEKFSHENASKYEISVATSDGLEQIIIRGAGCRLLSARDLLDEIQRTRDYVREHVEASRRDSRRFLLDDADPGVRDYLNQLGEEEEKK